MPTTASGWPYPTSTDTPDVPRDIAALATMLEGRAPYKILHGLTAVTPSLATQTALALSCDLAPAGFTQIPDLIGNLINNSYAMLNSYASTNILGIFRIWNVGTATASNLQVRWTAIQWTP